MTFGVISGASASGGRVIPVKPTMTLASVGNYTLTAPEYNASYSYRNLGNTGITSSTSTTIGTGSKTFTLSSVSGLSQNQRIRLVDGTGSAGFIYTLGDKPVTLGNFMEGKISSIVSLSVTVDVDVSSGSGTFAVWRVYSEGESVTRTGQTVTLTAADRSALTSALSVKGVTGSTAIHYDRKAASYYTAGGDPYGCGSPGSCYAVCGPTFPNGAPAGTCCWGGNGDGGGLCCYPPSPATCYYPVSYPAYPWNAYGYTQTPASAEWYKIT